MCYQVDIRRSSQQELGNMMSFGGIEAEEEWRGALEGFCTRLDLAELAMLAVVDFSCTTNWDCAVFASYTVTTECAPTTSHCPMDSGAW